MNPSLSYKNIRLTQHSIIRAKERLNITDKNTLKKMAALARRSGVRLDNIDLDSKSDYAKDVLRNKYKISYTTMLYFNSHFNRYNDSNRYYLYKNFIWIFYGSNGSVLKTVIPFDQQRLYNK